ncbi:MAG: glycoside hydrolase family 30 beta sandwich domain-containing protein [Chitinophagaceae bacterium]
MKIYQSCLLAGMLAATWVTAVHARQPATADSWLTLPDRSALFQQQSSRIVFNNNSSRKTTIAVNEAQQYQSIDGFGFALTGGSAQHIIRMSTPKRKALLQELFGTGPGQIGISYIRLSIGASDLNEHVFSYDDLPKGETDTALLRFDLGPDRADVIPVMKEILAINPKISILASPWSPPAWMKTIYDTRGGRLNPAFYNAYARYFVKYIQEMKAAGINIEAVTVQNEPLHPGNNPSILIPAPDMTAFVRDHLGPAFAAAHINTKIIIYDHNCDRPDYPISILNDPEARKYIDGSGFHLYGGKVDAMTDVHDAHPDKQIYFTEQMVVDFGKGGVIEKDRMNIASPVSRVMIGATRNWSRNVLLWNLAADPEHKPYTDRGGCTICQGAITLDKDDVTRNLAYYTVAHFSKQVRPRSVRIGSTETKGLTNVAFRTPAGQIVLVVANTEKEARSFSVGYKGRQFTTTLQPGAVATYSWKK